MVEQGALDEVSELLDRKLDPALPVMRAIGVPELSDFVRGVTALSEAMRAGQHATRRYAKRQYTWFGNQSPATWRSVTEPIEEATIELAVSQLS
jgi:tRNA dimethylallyltransferase